MTRPTQPGLRSGSEKEMNNQHIEHFILSEEVALKKTRTMIAIRTQQIKKAYKRVQALRGIDLEVSEGELFGLIGPDGAGKTTLIRILTSLIYADAGEASVLGLDPVKQYRSLRNKLGYMPGRFSLYQDLTVEENLTLFASLFETTIEENYHLIGDIYGQIEPFRDRKAGALSGGMKQKLALSCAMIHKPEILFLDEPTTGVDPVSRKEFWEMLKKLNAEGLTIFVSTPYMDEAGLCDRVALIQNGSLMAVDTPSGITRQFGKSLYAIRGEDKYGIMQDLKTYPRFGSVFSFGSELHYTDRGDEADLPELESYLHEMGHEVRVQKIQPAIEDAFMALMTQHDGD